MNLEDINFSGARVQEAQEKQRLSWTVLSGKANADGSVTFHLVATEGGEERTIALFPKFWEARLCESIRTVFFTRIRLNGSSDEYPDQPCEAATAFGVAWSASAQDSWMKRAQLRQRLGQFDFANAELIECRSNGRSEKYRIQKFYCGMGVGDSISFEARAECRSEPSRLVLPDGIWRIELSEPSRTVFFTRMRRNGDFKEFSNQPDEGVTGFYVRWKK